MNREELHRFAAAIGIKTGSILDATPAVPASGKLPADQYVVDVVNWEAALVKGRATQADMPRRSDYINNGRREEVEAAMRCQPGYKEGAMTRGELADEAAAQYRAKETEIKSFISRMAEEAGIDVKVSISPPGIFVLAFGSESALRLFAAPETEILAGLRRLAGQTFKFAPSLAGKPTKWPVLTAT